MIVWSIYQSEAGDRTRLVTRLVTAHPEFGRPGPGIELARSTTAFSMASQLSRFSAHLAPPLDRHHPPQPQHLARHRHPSHPSRRRLPPAGQRQTIHVDSNASDPQIANADLVMALAMATWRMKSLYPNPNPTPPPPRILENHLHSRLTIEQFSPSESHTVKFLGFHSRLVYNSRPGRKFHRTWHCTLPKRTR